MSQDLCLICILCIVTNSEIYIYHLIPISFCFNLYFGILFFFCLQTHPESRGHNFALNATFDDIEFTKYDGIIIPGGRSPEYLAVDASVL